MHSWLQHPIARSTINRRVTGDPDVPTVVWFRNRFVPQPVGLCLALGCGHGVFDRHAIELGIARHVHAIDISEEPSSRPGGQRKKLAVWLRTSITKWATSINWNSLPQLTI